MGAWTNGRAAFWWLLLSAALAVLMAATVVSTAQAATGDLLRSITAANPEQCGVNVGVAFDGRNLLVSCVSGDGAGHTSIDYINPADGSLVKSLQVPLPGVAAIAYDAGRGKLWACDSPTGGNSPGSGTEVYLIDPVSGSATDEFGTRGCWDGLAYDAADDTLWTSPDMSDTIYHYRLDGTLIGSFSGLTKSLGGVGNSGIAVGGSDLYLSNADGDTVYSTPKDFSTAPVPVATDPDHTEDMECDSVTFAPRDAMWVISAFDRTLNAYEIPAGSCGVGGQTVQHTPTAVTNTPPVVRSTGATFSGSVNPSGLLTTAHFEYGLDSRYTKQGTSGPVYDHSTRAHAVGSDLSSHTVSEQISGLVPNALYHVRLVATNSAGTTLGPDVTFRTAKSAPPRAPKLGRTFNIRPVRGIVLIKIHGVFVPLTELRQVPQNTPINALHGTLRLVTAVPGGARHPAHEAAANQKRHRNKAKPHKPKTKTQSGTFGGAIFKIGQVKRGANRGLVTLSLLENAFTGAPSYTICKRHPTRDATTARAVGLRRGNARRVVQLLHSSARGRFRTRGRYSAATVRGTKWTIADRCDGTLTHDITHSVAVTDFVRHKTIILHAGQRYLAKARKRK